MSTEELLIDILRELKTQNRQARLWDLSDIADYFNLAKNSVSNRVVCKADFPKPVKLPGVGKRWMPAEVKAYAAKYKVRRVA